MTDLLYLPDEDDVTDFEAMVVEASADSIVLDGTYFYPKGGGQPADRGTIEWDGGSAAVVDVRKDHGDIHHEIDDFDMCPCGGTHVDRTGEISPIEITNRLSKGADVERIEFELREN